MTKSTTFILTLILLGLPYLATASVLDQTLLSGVPCAQYNAEACTLCDFMQVFINASNLIVGFSGVFAVLMFVWGGVTMIVAYGNDAKINEGKDIIRATVTGIIIVFLAWTLVNFLIEALTGAHGITGSGQCSQSQLPDM